MAGYKTGARGTGAPTGPVVQSGWLEAAKANHTTKTPTTWLPADQGTQPVVDGTKYDIVALDAVSAGIGTAAGLNSGDATCQIDTVHEIDLSDRQVLAFIWGSDDTGSQNAVWFGSSWNDCWAVVRTGATTVQVQRRVGGVPWIENHTLNEGTVAAQMLVCMTTAVELWSHAGPLDLDALPSPDDSGWSKVGSAHNSGITAWGVTSALECRSTFWQNGTTAAEKHAETVYTGTPL